MNRTVIPSGAQINANQKAQVALSTAALQEAVGKLVARYIQDIESKENPVSKTLEAAKTVHVAAIERHGEKLTIPANMNLQDAAALIKARMEYEDTEVRIMEKFDVLPFDGAHALNEVLRAKFGWAQGVAIESFFGQIAPMLLSGEVAPGAARHDHPRRSRRSSANAGRHWRKCSMRFRRRVIAARSATPKATRSAGTAISCISTPPTVACPSRRCSQAPRCTTAVPLSRYR